MNMANKDTEVGITLTSTMSEVANDTNYASDSVDKLIASLNKLNQTRLNKLDQFTRSMRRMNEINLAKINTNLRRTAEYVTDFVTRFQTKEMDTAVNQLDRLTYSMNGVFSVFKSIQNIKSMDVPALTTLSNITFSAVDTAKLDKMMEFFNSVRSSRIDQASKSITALISSFERMGALNFNPTMENNINSQMTKMAESLRYFMNGLNGIDVDGFVKVSKGVASVTNAMKAIEKLNASAIGEKFETISTKIRSFIVTLNEGKGVIHDFATVLTKIGGTGSKGVNTSEISKSLTQVKKDIKDTGNEADKTKRKLNNMLSFGKIYALYNQARHYGQGILNMLNQSIDFAEIENYFSRAMGNMRSEAMKFQETLSESFGMATPAMMQAQATFKNMIGALGGIDDDVAYGLSERITKMVLDYSSLYNTTIDSAITKFQAALSKQVRPIRSQSGYDITQKVLESTMEMIGINDRSIAQMGEMEKRLLIILTLQYQMARSSAMGDFARTIKFSGFTLRSVSNNLVNASKSGVVVNYYC